jgi:hypothetical protein
MSVDDYAGGEKSSVKGAEIFTRDGIEAGA